MMLFDLNDYQEFDVDYRMGVNDELKALLRRLFPQKIIDNAAYIRIQNDSNHLYQSLRGKYSVSLYNGYRNHIDGVLIEAVPQEIYAYVKRNHDKKLENVYLA